jgi:hypothetical protein
MVKRDESRPADETTETETTRKEVWNYHMSAKKDKLNTSIETVTFTWLLRLCISCV